MAKECERCQASDETVGFSVIPVLLIERLLTVQGTFCLSCREKIAAAKWLVDGNKATLQVED